ncbi:MAG: hypothetical protein ACXAEF_06190 [Candidatus Thorarchaeota archaeon]|jgi:hypothetical protein
MRSANTVIVAMFLVELVLILFAVLSGNAWVILEPNQLALGLILYVPLMFILCGTIMTFSIVHYQQNKHFRDIILILLCVNIMISAFMYLVTQPALAGISEIADRERNRTIVTAFGLILAPTALLGSISRDSHITFVQKIASTLWGAIFSPIIYFWFFLSEEPVFETSIPDLGILGLKPIAIIILVILLPIVILAVIKSFHDWWRDRELIGLAFAMMMTLTLAAVFLFVFQSNPLQMMELVWYSSMLAGFLIISTAMVVDSILEPRRIMQDMIKQRTAELEQARLETEFYLNIWSHKIGNVLQGMTMYLELISPFTMGSQEGAQYQKAALELSEDANIINKQVATLTRVVSKLEYNPRPMNISSVLTQALHICEELVNTPCFGEVDLTEFSDINVNADELIESVFVNILAFIVRSGGFAESIVLEEKKIGDYHCIEATYSGDPLSNDVLVSLFTELQPSDTTLSLDLYLVNLLMQRYDGIFEYHRLADKSQNLFRLGFRPVQN